MVKNAIVGPIIALSAPIRRRGVIVALVLGLAWWAWPEGEGADESLDAATAAHRAALIANHVWLDRVPHDARDMVRHMVLLDHSCGRVGALARASKWRAMIEGVRWRLDGDQLTLALPQERHRVRARVRARECAGQAPEPFDLCLDLRVRDRTLHLFSRHDWEIKPGETTASLDVGETWPGLQKMLESAATGESCDSDEEDALHLGDDDSPNPLRFFFAE